MPPKPKRTPKVNAAPLGRRLTSVCESFPEVATEAMGDHIAYRVRKKVLAYFLNNHHGDGIVAVCVKTLPGDNARLIQSDPSRFCMPAYIGSRGWVSLRLDTGKVDWDEVREMVLGSYLLTAPRKLADQVMPRE